MEHTRPFLSEVPPENLPDPTKYPALNTISVAYKLFGYLSGIVTLIMVIYSVSNETESIAFVSFLVGGFFTLTFLALSESIKVFLDIEKNTRKVLANLPVDPL